MKNPKPQHCLNMNMFKQTHLLAFILLLFLFLQCSFQCGSIDSEVSGSAQFHVLHQIDLFENIQRCGFIFQRSL